MSAEARLGASEHLTFAPSLPERGERPSRRLLAGGVVAHNEEGNIERALGSLLEQALPGGVEWSRVWVVASGCTDRTVEVAQKVARSDDRVRVLVEPERTGKAHALGEIFRHASGDSVVLLNGDARAQPGAVAELLRVGRGAMPPYAVMGRPVVPPLDPGRWTPTLELMWELHHRFHRQLQQEGGGAHLSDELLLVSLAPPPPLPEGTINDGSYFGVWLAEHGGSRSYAEEARVTIAVPHRWRDHLHQRRRILFGNAKVTADLGRPPSTLVGYALRHPATALRLMFGSAGSFPRGGRALAALVIAELSAHLLALWDRLPPRRDHVRWRRMQVASRATRHSPAPLEKRQAEAPILAGPSSSRYDRRVSTLVEVAAEFGTGVPLADMLTLLPTGGPGTTAELRAWIGDRPDIARVEGDRAFVPRAVPGPSAERKARAAAYRGSAARLFSGPLRPVLPWVRCVAVTGSVAYGEPSPGDDLDLFVACRSGSLYAFLAFAYLAVRLERLRHREGDEPTPCFNYVVDERRAARDYGRDRGLLFAREALSAAPLVGEEYYRSLLGGAGWMRSRLPGLYDLRGPLPRGPPRAAPVATPVRVANALLFPVLATYLQLVGLYRNERMHRGGEDAKRFRTVTRPDGLAFVSHRFEALRRRYDEDGAPAATGGDPIPSPSHRPLPR